MISILGVEYCGQAWKLKVGRGLRARQNRLAGIYGEHRGSPY